MGFKISISISIILILSNAMLMPRLTVSFYSEQTFKGFEDSIELILGLSDTPSSYQELTDLLTKHNIEIVGEISTHNKTMAIVAKFPITIENTVLTEICTTGLSRYIEPNARVKVVKFEPNDPEWTNSTHQWGMQRINANWAWNITRGSRSVLAAIVDTGIDYNHEDLNRSYVLGGFDWVNNDNDPMDDEGHGTHCAGVVAAEINNGKGIAGLAQVRIMAEKSIDADGYGKPSDLANGILHAADQGANIISMSWGTYFRSNAIYDAVQHANNAGALLLAAAGNEEWSGRLYPAAFNEVIAVTATIIGDKPAEYTNYGNWVELAAPGGNRTCPLWSTLRDNKYGDWYTYGTSVAVPHVAGVAALIWSRFPDMTRDQVRVHLQKTAVDLGAPGFDEYYGYGRIDANASVARVPPDHDLVLLKWQCPVYMEMDKPSTFNITVHNYGTNNESNVTIQLWAEASIRNSTVINFLSSGETKTVSLSWTPPYERIYNITCRIVPVNNETDTSDNIKSANVTTETGIIEVGPSQRYKTIQEALDAARPGDTIIVTNGTYNEVVNVYKHFLTLKGENKKDTIIDCKNIIGTWGFIVVNVQNIRISGFTVKRARGSIGNPYIEHSGILLHNAKNSILCDNIITNNVWQYFDISGIRLTLLCENNTITNNIIRNNFIGITLYKVWHTNIIKGNLIMENVGGVFGGGMVLYQAQNNSIYHNNFINNAYNQLINDTSSSNHWCGRWGVSGNYWSDYNGSDDGSGGRIAGDGIGDTNLPHQKVDNHPLMGGWLPGDITHDRRVDGGDLARLGAAWYKRPSDPDWYTWHAHADLNEDAIVNAGDLAILSTNWGKTWEEYWEI